MWLLACAVVFVAAWARIGLAVAAYRARRARGLNGSARRLTVLIVRELLTNVGGSLLCGAWALLALLAPHSFEIAPGLGSVLIVGGVLLALVAYAAHQAHLAREEYRLSGNTPSPGKEPR